MSKGRANLAREMKLLDSRLQRIIQSAISSNYGTALEIAQDGADRARKGVDYMGSYKEYVDKSGKTRSSSKPGDMPSSPSGNPLHGSFVAGPISKRNANPAEAFFGNTAPYAIELEYGTKSMSPRPFMRPVREELVKGPMSAADRVATNFGLAMIKKSRTMKRQNVILEVP